MSPPSSNSPSPSAANLKYTHDRFYARKSRALASIPTSTRITRDLNRQTQKFKSTKFFKDLSNDLSSLFDSPKTTSPKRLVRSMKAKVEFSEPELMGTKQSKIKKEPSVKPNGITELLPAMKRP